MRPSLKSLIWAALALASILVLAFHSLEPFVSQDRKINIVFRYDDYSAVSATSLEHRIVDIFRKNGSTCSFGVVPFVCSGDVHDLKPQTKVPLTGDKAAFLKKASEDGVVEVGLHGYDHQTLRPKQHGYTEFQGLTYEQQLQKVSDGKKYLESLIGSEVTTFIPPWNSYDDNTLLSLEAAGFKIISGDFDGVARQSSTLQFIPSTSTIGKVRHAVHRARWNPSKAEQLIVVLFHDYDFKEYSATEGYATVDELADTVAWAASQPDIRILSLQQAGEMAQDLNAQKYMAYQNFHKIAPATSLELLFPIGTLSFDAMKPSAFWLSWLLSMLIYGGFYSTCLYLVYMANRMLFKGHSFVLPWVLELFLRVATVATFSLFVIMFIERKSYRTLIVSALLAGLVAGINRTYFRYFKDRKKGASAI